MKHVMVAWCSSNDVAFEEHVPLLFVGRRNQKLNFNGVIDVIFLEGLNKLSARYRKELETCGYILHDASVLFKEYAQRYAVLIRFGDYERKCFLRWLVIEKFFSGEPLIHYDGDIVFNEDPEIIAKKIFGKTFILQGCPAFTSISDPVWYKQYRTELDAFSRNIDEYSEHAWRQRSGWEVTFDTRWSGSRFRKIISSDQDLLSHLVHTGLIKQDSIEDVRQVFDDYVVFQNPLLFHMYNKHIPYAYFRKNGIDYFSYQRADGPALVYTKKVLLWHMQSCFNFYASKCIMNRRYFPFLRPSRVSYNASGKLLSDSVNKHISRLTRHTTRRSVYTYFFQDHDFSCLMNRKKWWKSGVFE